jgi:hypothetical protein
MAYTIKEIKKIYENKFKEINKNIEFYGNIDRNQVVEHNIDTFDYINEQVDILDDDKIRVEYEFNNNMLLVTVYTNDKTYSYNFNCNNCDIKKGDLLLGQTGRVYLNMFVKNQLVNEMNNIKIANNIKLNVVNSNKALFTKEHNYIGGFDINIKKNEEIISISKNMEKIEINENEIPNWVKEELSKNKMRKIFRRR